MHFAGPADVSNSTCSKNIKQHWGFKLQGCNSVHTKHMHPVQACSCPEESHCVDCALNTRLWNWDKWDLCFSRTVGEYWSLSTTLTAVIIVLCGLIMLTTMHNETFNSLIVHSGTEKTPAGDKGPLWGCVHCQTLPNQTKIFFFKFCISYNSKISNCCYRLTEATLSLPCLVIGQHAWRI